MVYTVTFNPSLDYVVQVNNFQNDAVNRAVSENVYAGGKGNNVAVVISNLGLKSRALGFRAGFTGMAMEQMLREYGCDTDFIPLDEGMTRINVKVKAEDEFEINGQGPVIPDENRRADSRRCAGTFRKHSGDASGRYLRENDAAAGWKRSTHCGRCHAGSAS